MPGSLKNLNLEVALLKSICAWFSLSACKNHGIKGIIMVEMEESEWYNKTNIVKKNYYGRKKIYLNCRVA
jgi:hypothetical protein